MEAIKNPEEPEDVLSRPSERLKNDLKDPEGDILIPGAGGRTCRRERLTAGLTIYLPVFRSASFQYGSTAYRR